MFDEDISGRAVGQLPLSIATSLAIESALGIHPDIPVASPPILDYKQLWVNVRTLFRNLTGALEAQAYRRVGPGELSQALLAEMEQIQEIIATETKTKTQVIFYFSDYANLEIKYRFGVVRRDNTEAQKIYTLLQKQTLEQLLKLAPDLVQVFELKLLPQHKSDSLILTHYAYDLVSWPAFNKLMLLESHSGAIKPRAQWHTKYLNGKDLPMIPFREDFLQVFGDSQTFRPADPKLRRELVEIAKQYNWTAVTTKDKIVYGINQMKNPMYRAALKSILI